MFSLRNTSLRAAVVFTSLVAGRSAAAQVGASGTSTSASAFANHTSGCAWSPFDQPAIDARCALETTSNGVLTYGDLLASVDAQRKLHAKAFLLTERPFYSFGGNTFDARANAMMWDRLEFVGPVIPKQVRMTVRIDGRIDEEHEEVRARGELLGYFGGSEPAEGLTLTTPAGTYGAASARWVAPLVGSTLDFALELAVSAHLEQVDIGGTAWLPPCTLRATNYCGIASLADLSNTAWLDLVEGLDENGDVITSGLQLRTASGVAYGLQGGAAVTATPEPAPLLLTLGGVALIGAVAVRRRIVA